MGEKVVAESTYITEEVFNGAVDSLKQQISDLSQKVQTGMNTMRDSLAQETIAREAAISGERKARESALESLRGDVSEVNDKAEETRQDLAKIDGKLDNLGKGLGQLNGKLTSMNGIIGTWKVAVDATMDRAKGIETQLKEANESIDKLEVVALETQAKHDQMYKTIHGRSDEDGPDSLFSMIRDMDQRFTERFDMQNAALIRVNATSSDNATMIQTIVRQQQESKKRREKRRAAAIAFVQSILSNKQVMAIIATVLVGIVIGLFPDAREAILEIFRSLLEEGTTTS